MLTPALDLTRYHARYEHGDLHVYLAWWTGAEDEPPRPCIVLLPIRRQSWEKAKPAVVLLEQAWLWSDIGDPAYAVRCAFAFCKGLGLDEKNPSNVIRVRSLINEHLGDLLAMPPMPMEMRRVQHMGDMTIVERETGVKREIEVSERI